MLRDPTPRHLLILRRNPLKRERASPLRHHPAVGSLHRVSDEAWAAVGIISSGPVLMASLKGSGLLWIIEQMNTCVNVSMRPMAFGESDGGRKKKRRLPKETPPH